MKRISALFVTLCIALVSFAQGSVTVTQSSAISDLVNNKSANKTQPAKQTQQVQPKPQTQAKPQTQPQAQPKPQSQTQAQPKPQPQTASPAQPQQSATDAPAGGGTATESGTENPTVTAPSTPHVVHTYRNQQPRKVVPRGTDEEIAAMVKVRGGDYSTSDGIGGKKVMRGAHKIKGWRLQVYNGGNKRSDREKAEELGKKVKQHYPGMPVYVHFYSPRWMTKCGNFRTHKEAEPYKTALMNLGFKSVSIVRQEIIIE